MPHRTARTIGKRVVPSLTAASGSWSLGEVTAARQDEIWPLALANPIPDLSPTAYYDCTDATTMYDAITGGSNVTTGNLVARLEDISGNGYHLTQATAASQPTLTAAVLNGYAGLTFAAGDIMANSGTIVGGATNRTIIAVCSGSTSSSNRVFYLGTSSATAGAQFAVTGEIAVRVASGNRVFTTSLSSTHAVLSVALDGTDCTGISAWLNGSALSESSTSNQTLNTASGASIGDSLGGDILELAVFDSALATADREAVETYLQAKYGI